MKYFGIICACGLIATPLLAQVRPDTQPTRPDQPQPRPRTGVTLPSIGIGFEIKLKRKSEAPPEAPNFPALEMVDEPIAEAVANEVLFFVIGQAVDVNRIARAAGVDLVDQVFLDALGNVMVRTRLRPGDTIAAATARLKAQAGVESVQPNFQYQLLGTSARERGVALHGIVLNDRDTVSGTILMIDSVIDTTNRVFEGAKINQHVFAENPAPSAHGTAVAEILVGTGRSGGVARGANLISLAAFEPVSERSWLSTSAKLLAATNMAVRYSPNVVNLSFGADVFDPKLDQMLDVFERRGVCVVAAAGNSGGAVKFPARRATSIAVTAVAGNGSTPYQAASRGPEIDIAAWGVGLVAETPGGPRIVSGTSFATAVVSGGLLRLNGCNGGAMPAASRAYLTSRAKDIGAVGRDDIFGAGLFQLNARRVR
jgi:hypothetical protein